MKAGVVFCFLGFLKNSLLSHKNPKFTYNVSCYLQFPSQKDFRWVFGEGRERRVLKIPSGFTVVKQKRSEKAVIHLFLKSEGTFFLIFGGSRISKIFFYKSWLLDLRAWSWF